MTDKKQIRKPELKSIRDLRELRTLIPGDTLHIYRPHPLENLYGVPKGYDYWAVYEENIDDWLSFLRLDWWEERKDNIHTIRINTSPEILGRFIFAKGDLEILNGAYNNEDGGFYAIASDESAWTENIPKNDLQRKVELLNTGKQLVKELYTFDKIIYTNKAGRVIRVDENSVLPGY